MWLAEMRRLWSHIAEGGRGCDKTLMLNSCREEAWVTSKMLRACSISTYTMQYTHTLYFIVITVAVHGIRIPMKTWSSKRSANKQMKRCWEGKFRQRSLQRWWPFFFSWHTNKRIPVEFGCWYTKMQNTAFLVVVRWPLDGQGWCCCCYYCCCWWVGCNPRCPSEASTERRLPAADWPGMTAPETERGELPIGRIICLPDKALYLFFLLFSLSFSVLMMVFF